MYKAHYITIIIIRYLEKNRRRVSMLRCKRDMSDRDVFFCSNNMEWKASVQKERIGQERARLFFFRL